MAPICDFRLSIITKTSFNSVLYTVVSDVLWDKGFNNMSKFLINNSNLDISKLGIFLKNLTEQSRMLRNLSCGNPLSCNDNFGGNVSFTKASTALRK